MIIIKVNKGENIDRALKRYKRKMSNTKTLKELRERKQFDKPSTKRRREIQKAIYIQKLNDSENK
tara:strand:+ start:56354 stop:56548 length:195 start_codon:yes stop_codon:yes gene_type:complete